MIKKIKIKDAYRTIPADFLLGLKQMTVITGENNSGKTNFIKTVVGEAKVKKEFIKVEFLKENDIPIIPKIVYIAAENIKPSDNESKSSAKTTSLIKNLSELFSNLEIKFQLARKEDIISKIKTLRDKTNENLVNFTGGIKHRVEININENELDPGIVIQSLIKNIVGYENNEERELDNLGQGTQRIIIASILKSYLDILIEEEIQTDKSILIVFEEPEIYLHPKLKRTLNSTLEEISRRPNHQVIITTHDAYFVFQNLEGKNIVSFEKGEDGFTRPPLDNIISGIEDEPFFIFLYSKLEDNKDYIKSIKIEGIKDRIYINEDNLKREDYSSLENIRHQIHHAGTNKNTFRCGVSKREEVPEGKNYYTQEELSEAIKKMSEGLSK